MQEVDRKWTGSGTKPPVQVRGGGVVQGGAAPLVRGVDGGAARHQGLQARVVAAGGRVVQGGSG